MAVFNPDNKFNRQQNYTFNFPGLLARFGQNTFNNESYYNSTWLNRPIVSCMPRPKNKCTFKKVGLSIVHSLEEDNATILLKSQVKKAAFHVAVPISLPSTRLMRTLAWQNTRVTYHAQNSASVHTNYMDQIFVSLKHYIYDRKSIHHSLKFLDYCRCCKKDIRGQDVYLLRGEFSFCSPLCRAVHIIVREYGGDTDFDRSFFDEVIKVSRETNDG